MSSNEKSLLSAVVIVALVAIVTVIITAPRVAPLEAGFDYSSIANVITAFTAIGALIYSVIAYRRTQQRYGQDIAHQERLAAANVRPLLNVRVISGQHIKQVVLRNTGLGSAVNIEPSFTKDGEESRTNLYSIISFWPTPIRLDETVTFDTRENEHMLSGEETTLILLTRENVISQGFDGETTNRIFNALNAALHGVEIVIRYEDVFGNRQPDYHRVL